MGALSLAALLSCVGGGGQVQFISDRVVAPTPSPSPSPRRVTESFAWRQSTGSPAVAWVLYPRKSMREVVAKLEERIGEFAEGYAGTVTPSYVYHLYTLGRDSSAGIFNWGYVYYYYEAKFRVRDLTRDLSLGLSSFRVELGGSESETHTPAIAFRSVIEPLKGSSFYRGATRPFFHFIYVRDAEAEEPDPETGEAIRVEIDGLLADLSREPYSRFRHRVHYLGYLDAGSACAPLATRLSTRARELLGGLIRQDYELCRLMDPAASDPGAVLREIAAKIHEDQARMILRVVPNLETLDVSLPSGPIPRDQIVFDRGANELKLTELAATGLETGASIQVSYEPAE